MFYVFVIHSFIVFPEIQAFDGGTVGVEWTQPKEVRIFL